MNAGLGNNNNFINDNLSSSSYYLNINYFKSNLHIIVPIFGLNEYERGGLDLIYTFSDALNYFDDKLSLSIEYSFSINNDYIHLTDGYGNTYQYDFLFSGLNKSYYRCYKNGTSLIIDHNDSIITIYSLNNEKMIFDYDSNNHNFISLPKEIIDSEGNSTYILLTNNTIRINYYNSYSVLLTYTLNNGLMNISDIKILSNGDNPLIIRNYDFRRYDYTNYKALMIDIFKTENSSSTYNLFLANNIEIYFYSQSIKLKDKKNNDSIIFDFNSNNIFTDITDEKRNYQFNITYNTSIKYTHLIFNDGDSITHSYYGYDNYFNPAYIIDRDNNIKYLNYKSNGTLEKEYYSFPLNEKEEDNLIENGYFNNGTNFWDLSQGGTIYSPISLISGIPNFNSKFIRLFSKISSSSTNYLTSISQDINVSGKPHSNFILSFFYREYSSSGLYLTSLNVIIDFIKNGNIVNRINKTYYGIFTTYPIHEFIEANSLNFSYDNIRITFSIPSNSYSKRIYVGGIKIIKSYLERENIYSSDGLLIQTYHDGIKEEYTYKEDYESKVISYIESKNKYSFNLQTGLSNRGGSHTYISSIYDNYYHTTQEAGIKKVSNIKEYQIHNLRNVSYYEKIAGVEYLKKSKDNNDNIISFNHDIYIQKETSSNLNFNTYQSSCYFNNKGNIDSINLNNNETNQYQYTNNNYTQKANKIINTSKDSSNTYMPGFTYSYDLIYNDEILKRVNLISNNLTYALSEYGYDYEDNNIYPKHLISKKYGNNTFLFTYDEDKIINIKYNNNIIFSFTYDELNRHIDEKESGPLSIKHYTYDKYDNLTTCFITGLHVSYYYDGYDNNTFISYSYSNSDTLIKEISNPSPYPSVKYLMRKLEGLLSIALASYIHKIDENNVRLDAYHQEDNLDINHRDMNINSNSQLVDVVDDIICLNLTSSLSNQAILPKYYIGEWQNKIEVGLLLRPLPQLEEESNGRTVLQILNSTYADSYQSSTSWSIRFYLLRNSDTISRLVIEFQHGTDKYYINNINCDIIANEYQLLRLRVDYSNKIVYISLNNNDFTSYPVPSDVYLGWELFKYLSVGEDSLGSNKFIGALALPYFTLANDYLIGNEENTFLNIIDAILNHHNFDDVFDINNVNEFSKAKPSSGLLFPLDGNYDNLNGTSFDTIYDGDVSDFIYSKDINSYVYKSSLGASLSLKNYLPGERGSISILIKGNDETKLHQKDKRYIFDIDDGYLVAYINSSNYLCFLNFKNGVSNSLSTNILIDDNTFKRLSISYVRTGSSTLSIYVSYDNNTYSSTLNMAYITSSNLDTFFFTNKLRTYPFMGRAVRLYLSPTYINLANLASLTDIDDNILSISNQYDYFSRLSVDDIYYNSSSILKHEYKYKNITNPREGLPIAGETSYIINKDIFTYNNTSNNITYAYNDSNKITQITNGLINKTYNYTYNSKGYLTDCISSDNLESYHYTYDNKGNMLTRSLNNIISDGFTYDDMSRLMLRINNRDRYIFNYDNNDVFLLTSITKNNSSYLSLSYIGHRLAQLNINNNVITYSYDASNFRYEKVVNNITHKYNYINGKLIHYSDGSNNVYYLYDSNNELYGFKLNNEDYYFFIKDINGVIHKIIDSNGIEVVTYSYDPFARLLNTIDNSTDNLISNVNVIIYKSYVYDKESELYYLINRYYSPILARFIQIDDVSYINNEAIGGLNLYIYCNNDPILYKDEMGKGIVSIIVSLLFSAALGAIIGGATGGIYSLILDYKDNKSIDGSIGSKSYLINILNGILNGTITGLVSGIGGSWTFPLISGTGSLLKASLGFVAAMGLSFAGGVGSYAIEMGINNKNMEFVDAMKEGAMALPAGLVSYFAGSLSSFINWEGGKTIRIFKESINVSELIVQNFVGNIFSNPSTWIIDFIKESF